jgi:hypothetical protein
VVIDTTGNVGIGTTMPYVSLDLHSKTDALALPVGTQGQEPSSPVNGMIRYSTTANHVEAYIAGAWTTLTTGGDNAGIYLGTSANNTNPQRSNDATNGLFSQVGTSVAVAAAGSKNDARQQHGCRHRDGLADMQEIRRRELRAK